MWVWPRRPQSHHTHRETHRALQPRQRGSALPISTLSPAFLTACWLPVGTDHPAQPAHPQQPHTPRAPAGHRSPTKPTLSTASKDATRQSNAPRLDPWSVPAAPRPAARRRRTAWPPSPRSPPPKRHRNPPSHQNQRAATPRTHTGWKQRPVLPTTIPTPCTRSRTVSTKRETVPGT